MTSAVKRCQRIGGTIQRGEAKASPSALLQSSNVPGDFIPALCRYRISRTFTSTLGDSMKSLSTLPERRTLFWGVTVRPAKSSKSISTIISPVVSLKMYLSSLPATRWVMFPVGFHCCIHSGSILSFILF